MVAVEGTAIDGSEETASLTTSVETAGASFVETAGEVPADGAVLGCQVPELVRCAERGDTARVLQLLRTGIDADVQDDFGITGLHGAAKKGHVEVASLLLEWRADVQVKTHWGETPLHYASKYGRTAVVKLLMSHGADAAAVSAKGQPPADAAREKHHDKTVKLLTAAACRSS